MLNAKQVLDEIKNSKIYKDGTKITVGLKDNILFSESNAKSLLHDKHISEDEYWNIMLMVNIHDTLKMHAIPGSSIESKFGHSSLAKDFASEYFEDEDILNMIKYHDEPFALHRKIRKNNSKENRSRVDRLFENIQNWKLFVMFIVSIGCIPGSSRQPIGWLIYESNKRGVCDIDKKVVIS